MKLGTESVVDLLLTQQKTQLTKREKENKPLKLEQSNAEDNRKGKKNYKSKVD